MKFYIVYYTIREEIEALLVAVRVCNKYVKRACNLHQHVKLTRKNNNFLKCKNLREINNIIFSLFFLL